MKILNRLFPLEEINGHGRCPTYLYRRRLLSLLGLRLYLHHFVGDDWSLDLHDHPKRFVSMGLWGGHTEHTPTGARLWRAPWLRTFPGTHQHRITLAPFRSCWTLCLVRRQVRTWGFWHQGRWIHWREYVRLGGLGDVRKQCP